MAKFWATRLCCLLKQELFVAQVFIKILTHRVAEIMIYPSIGQYAETIKLAAKDSRDYFDKLRDLRPVLDANGEPIMSSGNFAVAFKMVDGNGKFYAARCFYREQDGREQSYKKYVLSWKKYHLHISCQLNI